MLLHFLWFSLLFFFCSSQIKGEEGGSIDTTITPSPQPQPRPNLNEIQRSPPFKPSVAVLVGVLTTIFSITFLILLYVKHCKRGNNNNNGGSSYPAAAAGSGGSRKNSGIDRIVIESLPVFKFGSLRGQKEGLECAVCLNKFEAADFLKLLPKCKHAFHVECVDTWLDAHSTCPLCRYRVHPEDILFVHHLHNHQNDDNNNLVLHHPPDDENGGGGGGEDDEEMGNIRRISGRHSSAGERGSRNNNLQVVVERPNNNNNNINDRMGSLARRSLDSLSRHLFSKKKMINNDKSAKEELLGDGTRKDRLLLTAEEKERRLGHRIIVSGGGGGAVGAHTYHRWSEVNPSDLLYLRSEMIISDSRRFSGASSSSSRPSVNNGDGINSGRWQRGQKQHSSSRDNNKQRSGRNVINSRSVSEITGLSRTRGVNINSNNNSRRNHHEGGQEERKAGVVSRWLAWISDSPSHSRSHHAPTRSHPSSLPL